MLPDYIKKAKKKRIISEIEESYGITKVPYLLFELQKKKIRAFSGSLSKTEINKLAIMITVRAIGASFVNMKEDYTKLSFDILPLFREDILKNTVNISDIQLQFWLKGEDLEISTKEGQVIIKHGLDIVGLGKSNGQKIYNYVPKERRIKKGIK